MATVETIFNASNVAFGTSGLRGLVTDLDDKVLRLNRRVYSAWHSKSRPPVKRRNFCRALLAAIFPHYLQVRHRSHFRRWLEVRILRNHTHACSIVSGGVKIRTSHHDNR